MGAPVNQRPLLEVTGLESGYGKVQVLWGVSLAVQTGELVALIGSNGAGKTTLLRSISGTLQPMAGNIAFAGADLTGKPADARARMGVLQVPEGRKLFAGMTVRENLLMGAFCTSDSAVVRRRLELVSGYFPELAERQSQLAGTLSGGQQQMCAIARALMGGPRLLMIDEMSLGLAPMVVDRLIEIVARINRDEEVTVLLVEQDVQVALNLASRAYVVEQGRVVMAGRSSELLDSDDVRRAYLGA